MKTVIIFLTAFLLTMAFAFIPPGYSLIGRWSIPNNDGSPSGDIVEFKGNSTYTVAVPDGQIVDRGNFLLKDSVFSIKNSKDGCGKSYWGKYYLTFYNSDSVYFSLIEDTCTRRRMDIAGVNPGLKRCTTK